VAKYPYRRLPLWVTFRIAASLAIGQPTSLGDINIEDITQLPASSRPMIYRNMNLIGGHASE